MTRLLRTDGVTLVALAVAFVAATCPGAASEALGAATMGTVLVGLLLVLPFVDPIGRVRWDDKPLPRVRLVAALLAAAGALALAGPLADAGPDQARRLAMLALVLFLGVAGNAFPSLKRNRYFGIRTPWTLRSDAVWERTHRLFGHAMVGSTAVLVALWPLLSSHAFERTMGIHALALAVGAVLYSWRLSRRLSSPT